MHEVAISPRQPLSQRGLLQVSIAEDFSVQYVGPYKVVTNELANETYVLYQCGTPPPDFLPAGAVPGLPDAAKAFQIPLHSVSVADTTVNGFLVRSIVKRSGGGGGSQDRPAHRVGLPSLCLHGLQQALLRGGERPILHEVTLQLACAFS